MNTYLLVHRHPHNYTGTPEAPPPGRRGSESSVTLSSIRATPSSATVASPAKPELSSPSGGYTIVSAANLEEATKLASGCPILPEGGAVAVGMLSPVPGRQHPARTF